MSRYRNFRFSITVQTDDRKLIGCLSAVAHVCQPENPRQIHIEGQKGGNWERNGHHAIFHFSRAKHLQKFIITARKMYGDTWKIKDQKEDDPPYDSN